MPLCVMVTIYMPLLDEGVETWRPVEATPLSGDTYRVDSALPDDEEWAFPRVRLFAANKERSTAASWD